MSESAPESTTTPNGLVDIGKEVITLTEFCLEKSLTDKRVELLGAFHNDEKRNKRNQDTEAAYQARYIAFANMPV